MGKGYAVSFALPGAAQFTDHAGVGRASTWAVPLSQLARLTLRDTGNSRIGIRAALNKTDKASANFNVDPAGKWNGTFTVTMPALRNHSLLATHSAHLLPLANETTPGGRITPYAFNLYVSKHVLAPRPFWLVDVAPGQTVSWQHRVTYSWRERTARPIYPTGMPRAARRKGA